MAGIRCLRGGWVIIGLLSACAGNNDRGRALYAEGRFIEAAEVFEHSETLLRTLAHPEHARYGLYRGMTLLRLGDLDGAAKWLHYARTSEARQPGSLRLREVTALRQAWQLLDQARVQEQRSPDPLHGALARSNAARSDSAPDLAPTNTRPHDVTVPDPQTVANAPNP